MLPAMPFSLPSMAMIFGAAVCLGLGYRVGHQSARADCETDRRAFLEQTQVAIDQNNAQLDHAISGLSTLQKKLAAVDQAALGRQQKTAATFQKIQKGQIDYASDHARNAPAAVLDCRLDPDGLRLWRAANANTDPGSDSNDSPATDAAAAPQPDRRLPGAAPALGGGLARAAGESYRRGTELPRVPGQADGAGRLGADQ